MDGTTKTVTRSATGAPRKRTTKAEQRAETMEQIYDAAEELFAQRGMYGVTFKDVAVKVGVHQSLLNYYFKDKQELFDAVMARRAPEFKACLMQALDAYEIEAGGKLTVEGVLAAFFNADYDILSQGGDGWRNYAQLGARMSNTPVWGVELVNKHFDEVVMRIIGLIQQALPDCPMEDLFWCYHFTSGALMLTLAQTGRIDQLSGGLCHARDFEAIKERMPRFMAAGFLATYEARKAQQEAGV